MIIEVTRSAGGRQCDSCVQEQKTYEKMERLGRQINIDKSLLASSNL